MMTSPSTGTPVTKISELSGLSCLSQLPAFSGLVRVPAARDGVLVETVVSRQT